MRTKKATKKNTKARNVQKYDVKREITGILLLSFGVLVTLSFYYRDSVGLFGRFVSNAFLGVFGLPAHVIPFLILIYSLLVIFRKNDNTLGLRGCYALILVFLFSALFHTGYYRAEDYENLSALSSIRKAYAQGLGNMGGGIIGGLISLPFIAVFRETGTIVILATLAIVDIILLTNISLVNFAKNLRRVLAKALRAVIRGFLLLKAERSRDDREPVPDEYEDMELEFKPEEKVIDFRLRKTAKELKEKTGKDGPQLDEKITPKRPRFKNYLIDNEEEKRDSEAKGSSAPLSIEIAGGDGEYRYYELPPIDLLAEPRRDTVNGKSAKSEAIEVARKLEDTLRSFGVEAKVVNITRGPAITRYELQPSSGVKVRKIVSLSDDIALNLASEVVRIEAPIPGKAAVGIEVPNKEVASVLLREIIQSSEFLKHPSKVAFALGKDISGECVIADISKMPHLLIAGATGSGKSVCINSLIVSILYKAKPDEVKLLLIDPKVVELGMYNGIPHLLIPVVTEPKKAAGALNWAVQEMMTRYRLFSEKGVRDIEGYNRLISQSDDGQPLPQVVIIIDELADLMMVAPGEVEDAICRLAQMARAAGMHLVIATQRPSVDVITGIIKANIPSRISFMVSSQVDSRTILDMGGAEKLLGRGDMLYHPVGMPKPIRVKGAFVSEREVESIVEFVKKQEMAQYDNEIIERINSSEDFGFGDSQDEDDELLPRAIEMVVESGQASASMIQRRFRIGYNRAARIIEQMEARGIVGKPEGSKPRQVLITKQQWLEMEMRD